MLLIQGILAALLETQKSGKGQVVDAAMVDGASQLMWMMYSFHAAGAWNGEERQSNLLDGAAHFYDSYETSDGKYVAIGSIEPQFYALLKELAGLSEEDFGDQNNQAKWPEMKEKIRAVFKTKTREEWCAIMEGTDVCFAPVLSLSEAPKHPHNVARDTFIEVDDILQPAPAPRFSRTPSSVRHGQHPAGQDTDDVLGNMGFSQDEIAQMRSAGAIG